VIGLLLSCFARAQATPEPTAPPDPPGAPAPASDAGPAGTAQESTAAAPTSDFTAPVPLTPLVVAWPADLPAPADAGPAPVDLDALINEAGAVEEVTVKAGDEPFAGLAVAALRAIHFTPATEAGAPVAVYVPIHLDIPPPPVNVDGVLHLAGARGAPAVGVRVVVAGQSQLTDALGHFAFRAVPPGAQVLTVTGADVHVAEQALTVVAGEALHLELFTEATEAPPVVPGVVGFYRRERDEVLRRTISAEELRTLPGTMGDPLRAISNLPGAVRTPLDAGWLLVRGGDPRDTGVYIDGTRVPLVYHLGGFTSVVHPGFIERVDFYPGGQSARYGRATAGAVDLLTRPRASKPEARVGANIVLAGAFVSAPIGKVGFSAGIRRSYLDGVLDLVPGITEAQAKVAPRFWDWQLRFDAGPVSILGLGYFDTIDASTADGNQAAVTTQDHRLHASWHGELFGKPMLVKPYFAYELNHISIDILEREQLQATEGGGGRVELADDGKGPFGWSAGVDASFDWFGMSYNDVERYAHIDSPDVYGDVRFGDKLRAVIGVRLDTLFVTDQLPRAAPSPRASLEVPVGEMLTLVADAGVYHQPPPSDLLVGPPEGSALRMEQSYGGGAGLRVHYGPWQLDVDGYDRTITRITGFEDDGSLGQGEGQAAGLETMLRYSGTRVTGWLSYTYARSQRREDVTDTYAPSTYDQPHTLVAVAAVDLGRHWTLGSRWRFTSGFPIPDGDQIQAYDVLAQKTELLVPDRFGRTEPFHALDLKISKQARYKNWRLEYYLDVQNVYNRRVAEPVISGVWEAYGTQTYGYGLPILPILGIEGVFGGDAPP
jgi:outer membrane receptor protein involved in Fe transport